MLLLEVLGDTNRCDLVRSTKPPALVHEAKEVGAASRLEEIGRICRELVRLQLILQQVRERADVLAYRLLKFDLLTGASRGFCDTCGEKPLIMDPDERLVSGEQQSSDGSVCVPESAFSATLFDWLFT